MIIAVIGFAVIARAIFIQQSEGEHWKEVSDNKHLKTSPILADRGTIYSEDGNMLSTSVPIFDVFIDFAAEGLRDKGGQRFRENIDSLSYRLADLFKDKSAAEYKHDLQTAYQNKLRYYPLKKRITFDERKALENFPLVRLGRNKSGFIIENREKRINPYVLFANRTIGLARNDTNMNVGLERTYNYLLQGINGQRLVRYSAGGYIPVEGSEIDPVNGKDIVTTLDTYMQDVAENALMDMMVGNNSVHGTAIVMEVSTGKIKAIANLGKQPNGEYLEDMNYGIGKATEPGSVFKLATVLSLMEDGYVTPATIVNCEGGAKRFYGLRIKDSHLGAGNISVLEAFERSSNVAFAKLADQYYQTQPSKFVNNLQRFGLTDFTGVDIVASSGKPTIKRPSNRSWGKTTIPFMAHGYEELVTPLHMVNLYNMVANKGKLMRPYLVSSIKQYGVELEKIEPVILNKQAIKPATVDYATQCLRAVVDSSHGTARRVMKGLTFPVAGKTGTAVTALDNRGYNKGNKIYQASFMGFFPADNPKYTIGVVIQNSRESKKIYGADVAGTVFRNIADKIYGRFVNNTVYNDSLIVHADSALYNAYGLKNDFTSIFNYLSVPVSDSAAGSAGYWRNLWMRGNTAGTGNALAIQSPKNIVPSVKGMGLKDAIYLLENKGYTVSVWGSGKVVEQTPNAGAALSAGKQISIMLN